MFNMNISTLSNVIKCSVICAVLAISSVTIGSVDVVNAHDHKKMDNAKNKTSMMITGAWARALPPVVPNGAAYLSLHNMGTERDILLSISSSIAKRSMLHESYLDDDKVAMRHIAELNVEAGQQVDFKPGGYHIMLMGLKQPLSLGTTFTVTLEFENAGLVEVPVTVIEKKPSKMVSHHH